MSVSSPEDAGAAGAVGVIVSFVNVAVRHFGLQLVRKSGILEHLRMLLECMVERVSDQLEHVLIGQRVTDMASRSASLDQPLQKQESETMRDGRDAFTAGLG